MNVIKNELFTNIAEMNGRNINSQLKHQHKLSDHKAKPTLEILQNK